MEANQSNRIEDTTATKRIFDLKKRIRAVAGGTSASKTVSIIIWLIDYCQQDQGKEKLATVVSQSYPHLEKGAMLDFETIMKDREYWDDKRWNKSKHIYTFESKNKLEFFSVDTYGKAHGPRRDVLFLNEANNLHYNIADQLITRTRETVFMDWNPTNEFWFYTEMLGLRDDIDFITLTYKDNEALDKETINEIESHKHIKSWWQVYGLGQLGEIEGRIYTTWKTIDEIPEEAKLIKYGLDFGYSNDPTALVAIYKWNDSYIVDEIIYQRKLKNHQIAEIIQNHDTALIIADSAEPKSIDELREDFKIPIDASPKGKDSVNNGIQKVQAEKIFVTKRSLNILREYRNYIWQEDKDGNIINVPIDVWNHAMDAIRYAFSSGEKVEWTPAPQGGVKPYWDELHI